MKSAKKQKKIYRLKDISIEEIVTSYLNHHTKGTFGGIKLSAIPSVIASEPQPEIINKGETSRKYRGVLEEKFTYLIHLIRNRQVSNGGGFVQFHSVVLESIFGKDYKRMIDTLLNMDILMCDNYYFIGKKSYSFRFNNTVSFTYTMESCGYLSKYSDKASKILGQYSTEAQKEAKATLGNNILFERYNQSLKLLKLAYINECRQYLSLHHFINNLSEDYHYHILDSYLNDCPTITSIDKNNRIYSIATSTPRIIKPFLNIKFSCDIHNSHPLLFNKILFDHYDISLSLRKSISSSFKSLIIEPHNVRRFIRKSLINNHISKEDIADIPTDVLAYMYITSIGRFWDVVITPTDTSQLLRSDIKVLMFAEVFYSKKLTTRGQKYAKLFKAQFPNVYKVVRKQKESDRTRLANDMMRLESKLFHQILMKLYNKRYRVVSIHDAVIVLDVKANDSCNAETVNEVIRKVYADEGLSPDVSVDNYGKEYVDSLLINEEKANRLITDFMTDLQNHCIRGDEEAINIKQQLDCCEVEPLPNADYTRVILHPLHFR